MREASPKPYRPSPREAQLLCRNLCMIPNNAASRGMYSQTPHALSIMKVRCMLQVLACKGASLQTVADYMFQVSSPHPQAQASQFKGLGWSHRLETPFRTGTSRSIATHHVADACGAAGPGRLHLVQGCYSHSNTGI